MENVPASSLEEGLQVRDVMNHTILDSIRIAEEWFRMANTVGMSLLLTDR